MGNLSSKLNRKVYSPVNELDFKVGLERTLAGLRKIKKVGLCQ